MGLKKKIQIVRRGASKVKRKVERFSEKVADSIDSINKANSDIFGKQSQEKGNLGINFDPFPKKKKGKKDNFFF